MHLPLSACLAIFWSHNRVKICIEARAHFEKVEITRLWNGYIFYRVMLRNKQKKQKNPNVFSPVALSYSKEHAGGCSKFISTATAALCHQTVVASALVSFLRNVPQF